MKFNLNKISLNPFVLLGFLQLPFPKKLPFSEFVPKVYCQLKEFIYACLKYSEDLHLRYLHTDSASATDSHTIAIRFPFPPPSLCTSVTHTHTHTEAFRCADFLCSIGSFRLDRGSLSH